MLIRTIEEVKAVIPSSAENTDFNLLSTHLANAELQFISPLFGADMYCALLGYYTNPQTYKITDDLRLNNFLMDATSADDPELDNLSAHDKAWALLLFYTQKAIVNLAYYSGFDVLNVMFDNKGFTRFEGDTSKSLFKYQEDGLRKYFRNAGLDGLDTLLEILETRIQHFEAYKSQLYKHKGRIFPDTKSFNEVYFINNSRLVFDRLRQHMRLAEDLHLAPVITKANLDLISTELLKENPAQFVLDILPYVRKPIAYISSALLMQETGAELTDRGLYLKGLKNLNNSDLEINTPEARVVDLIARNFKIAEQYMITLRQFMAANASQWNNYSNPRAGLHNRDNSGKRTFFT